MWGVATPCFRRFRTAEFGPAGLYACPSPFSEIAKDEVNELVDGLKCQGILSVAWNVRFDHHLLAHRLMECDFSFSRSTTHVLVLDRPHKKLFSAYRPTRRNEIRRSFRQGLIVRRAVEHRDVASYCAVHDKLAKQKAGFRVKYPAGLIHEFVGLRDETILLVAQVGETIVAGALFFLDGDSMLYWHGAADREYSRWFATGALVDTAIKLACERHLATFNLGGSGTDSLRDYKESFGATTRDNWNFNITISKPFILRFRNAMRRVYGR